MNERLIVRTFGPIKDLDITFKKVTLFIGDQGTGKSSVAKLFSMFKWLEKVLYQKRYKVDYFEKYNRFKTMLLRYHRIDSFLIDDDANVFIKFEGLLYDFVYENCAFRVIDRHCEANGIAKIMYVPAERSIVSVAEGRTKLLKELPASSETFSDEFVNAKKAYKNGYDLPFEDLRFEYDSLNGTGWIHGDGYIVRLTEASSGIQSSLPMCMVSEFLSKKVTEREEVNLSKEEKDKLEKKITDIVQNDAYSETIKDMMIRQLSSSMVYNRFINIVEEPELNLFPESQLEVLFSLVANNASSANNMLVLTTHSPYSLAIINTLIMAGKVMPNANEEIRTSVIRTLNSDIALDPNDVAVYSLEPKNRTYCRSIVDPNTQMVSKNSLDSASEIIMRKFNTLYRLYAKTIS